jgi:hypothetical protein
MKLNYVIKFVGDMDRAVSFIAMYWAYHLSSSPLAGANLQPAKRHSHYIQPPRRILRELSSWALRFPIFRNTTRR